MKVSLTVAGYPWQTWAVFIAFGYGFFYIKESINEMRTLKTLEMRTSSLNAHVDMINQAEGFEIPQQGESRR